MASGQKMLTMRSGPHMRCDMNLKLTVRLSRQLLCLACKQILFPDAISFYISDSSRDSSADIATETSLYSTASEPAPESTQTLIQWAPRALSPGVKRLITYLLVVPRSRMVELCRHSLICLHDEMSN
jgi:hypothetical protein